MAAALTAVVSFTGARAPVNHANFDEITVGRINIIEPDGTKRLIISNKAQFPGYFDQGKEIERPGRRDFAGVLFINEEGTENGGFLQKGSINNEGKISSGLSLTFDRFRQDQTLQLISNDSENSQRAAISINDRPQFKVASIEDQKIFNIEASKLPETERRAYWDKLSAQNRLAQNRIYLGTTGDRGSALVLRDANGKVRMKLQVSAEGKSEIQMLDENGKVEKTISPTN